VRSGLVERPARASRARIEAGTALADEPLKSMMMRNKVPPGED
jgi:hypothetical protein